MESQPLVSIIVMTYNNYDLLFENLTSIMKQTYPNIELIIADDGSSNYDESFIRNILRDNNLKNVIIYTNENNVGTVKNYNCAIKKSSGKYIVPLSADDYFYENDFIYKLVAFFQKNPDCYVCTAKSIGENTKKIRPEQIDIDIMKSDWSRILNRLSYCGLYSGATLYFRREIFDMVGYFDEQYRLMEDYPFTIKLCIKEIPIYFIDEIAIIYGEKGVTSGKISKSSPLYLDMKQVLRLLYDNRGKINNKKCIRYLKYQMDLYSTHSSFILFFKYLDIYLCKLLGKYSKKKNFYSIYIGG